MGNLLSWLRSLFWSQEMEIAVLGLQNAGKSSFVQVINSGTFQESMIPTVGFNMHKVQKGKVTIKIWDMGGQEKFRSMWERYCRGVQTIVFVVDASEPKGFQNANTELQQLLQQKSLEGVPLLMLFNKQDLQKALKPEECAKQFQLDELRNRQVGVVGCSCKEIFNIDKALDWIIKRAGTTKNQ